ncbi:hypothetical protein ACC724_37980 [Rhizobium ruizarguesonis]
MRNLLAAVLTVTLAVSAPHTLAPHTLAPDAQHSMQAFGQTGICAVM